MGRPITEMEALGAIQVLTLGGFMTTADATCNLVVALIDNPELQDELRAHPNAIPPFIEEVLRLEPPVTTRARRCVSNVELRGTSIPAGDRVMVNVVAANRDPQEFERPDALDIQRDYNRHLTFGAGIHRCIGSTMARMTLRIALEELLARTRDMRFAEGQREQRISVSGSTWRLVDSMPIVFTPVIVSD